MNWIYDPRRRLILPVARTQGDPRSMGIALAMLGWQELGLGDPTTPAKMKALAGRLSTEAVIYLSSIVQMFVGSVRGPAREPRRQQQVGLARELLPQTLALDVVRRLEAREVDVVFHQEQLLLGARLAVAFGQPGPRGEWDKDAGGEFLLRINDCLHIAISGDDDDILRLVLRRLGAFPNEQERYLLPRYFDLLVTRARAKSGSPSPIDEAFKAETGLRIEQYLALGFAYSSLFTSIRTVTDLQELRFDAIVAGIEGRLAGAQEASAARAVLTADSDWYRGISFPSDRLEDLALANFMPFYDKPFFRLSSGSALPISLSLALQRLSLGIYWTAFTRFQRKATGVVDLNSYVGDLFQDYTIDALRLVYSSQSEAAFVGETEIEGSAGQVSCPDGVIVEGRNWISLEMTVSGLTMKTVLNGDLEGFRAELADDRFKRKFEQPVLGVENILLGRLRHSLLPVDEVTDIFPVLVMLRPFPQFLNTWPEIDDVYTPPRELQTASGRAVRVHRLQILTAEEIEMLEPGIGMGARLSDILAQKEAADPVRAMSMKNFIIGAGVAREHDNDRMRALFDEMLQVCRPILKELMEEAQPMEKG